MVHELQSERPLRWQAVLAVAAVKGVLAWLSVVPPRGAGGGGRVALRWRRRAAAKRFALSFVLLARRVELPREGGADLLEVPVQVALPAGASL